ncbi:MAG: DUF3592 domain-containing protein [Bacteroidales bacterium]|nr:DUF3592 domain-containing protein [Bacteroidales bacterium]
MKKSQRTFGIIWRLLVIVFIAFMLFMCLKGYRLTKMDLADFEKYSQYAEGVVVDVIYETTNGDASRMRYDFKVRFVTQDGVEVEFIDNSPIDLGLSADIGQIVPVKYMPDDPEYARIEVAAQQANSNAYLWMMAILSAITALLIVITSWRLIKYIKKSSGSIADGSEDYSIL